MRPTSDRKHGERGSQVVELAIALPLLLLLTFLVTEVAALVRVHQVINNAAREGARISAELQNQGDTTTVQNAATAYVNTYVPAACAASPPLAVTVDQGVSMTVGGISMTASKVTVSCNYQWVSLNGSASDWFGIPTTVPLRGTATFRNFY